MAHDSRITGTRLIDNARTLAEGDRRSPYVRRASAEIRLTELADLIAQTQAARARCLEAYQIADAECRAIERNATKVAAQPRAS